MDKLKKSRAPVRAQLTRLAGEIEQLLGSEAPDKVTIRVKLNMLQDTYTNLEKLDQEIMDLIIDSEVTEEIINNEFKLISEYKEKVERCTILVQEFLKGPPSESSQDSSRETGPQKTYRLPKIEIKKFNGDLTEWLGFWSQFEKIHEDPDIHASDKFQYLVQSIEPGTRAYRLVESYPQSAANYPKVMEALKDRFGDNILLAEVYVRQLLKLVNPTGEDKNARQLTDLYDKLESYMRALETLDITTDHSAIFLYPLIESSLPDELIKVWQRSALSDGEKDKPIGERLKALMQFLGKEVKGAERLSFVRAGLDNVPKAKKKISANRKTSPERGMECPTAAGLLATQGSNCIFCEKAHESKECIKAQNMTVEQKRERVQKANACFRCIKVGHTAKRCKSVVKCMFCARRHLTLLCPDYDQCSNLKSVKKNNLEKQDTVKEEEIKKTFSQLNCTSDFMLQTLLVDLKCGNKVKRVRALYDSGSQRSYILKATADELGLQPSSRIQLQHMLFGGSNEFRHHGVYDIEVSAIGEDAFMTLEVLDHPRICGPVPRMCKGPWVKELKQLGVFISDLREGSPELELLIGADYYAKLLTGKRCAVSNGLFALETHLGWTLSGKVDRKSTEEESSLAMTTITLHVQSIDIKAMWDLEIIGIQDPAEMQSKQERENKTKQDFFNTIVRGPDGRYIVSLPWINGPPSIPDNRNMAEKRLLSVSRKLLDSGIMENYDNVLSSWQETEFIEKSSSTTGGYYLPHRAVVKPSSSTTPLRPVFDASCKTGRAPSLNDCLEKGVNLLELLPNVLLRFREKPIGVTADIRKAFQMIEVAEVDRDYLKFLWWENYDLKVLASFRHKRVVFGLTCSPFILGAVIEYHLMQVPQEDSDTARKILQSFYVDNCITSVENVNEYIKFKNDATRIMATARMDLCQWEHTTKEERSQNMGTGSAERETPQHCVSNNTSVLGLQWDKTNDSLCCVVPEAVASTSATKRSVLSFISRVFDPIGILCPALLPLKLILQSSWASRLGWDEKLPEQGNDYFAEWQQNIECLQAVWVPRNITGGSISCQDLQLHVFCDASQDAYAAAVFLRVQRPTDVFVQLLLAKSRIAPIKRPTIPRLELLGCVIAARIAKQIKEALTFTDISTWYWSDSSTALAWIKGNDNWGTFVGNRVKEILLLTDSAEWRHVPGVSNPADLPSRGCTPQQLLASKWWEGPPWLKEPQVKWPETAYQRNEEEVNRERKCAPVKTKSMTAVTTETWYSKPFSSYFKNVRVIVWILRFVNRCKKTKNTSDARAINHCLSVVESAMNDRPLTIVTEDMEDLTPLRGIASADFPEYASSTQFQKNFQKRQMILKELQDRFRKEYLSQLENIRVPSVGDIVLVDQENRKRLEWPLARVTEVIFGRDGKVRVARVKTSHGMLSSSTEIVSLRNRKRN